MPDPPLPRLLRALVRPNPAEGPETLVVGARSFPDPAGLPAAVGGAARILVVSVLGAHPDAPTGRLRQLWVLEERARATGLPALTLRLGPIVGPASPLWLKFRARPRLPDPDLLLQPVTEADVVETLARALDGRAAWEGWYEVVGPEILPMGEWVEIAGRTGAPARDDGAWEPPPADLGAQRLAEFQPWSDHFALPPQRVTEHAGGWA